MEPLPQLSSLHHAYVWVGDRTVCESLRSYCADQGISTKNGAAYQEHTYDSFTIADARSLKQQQQQTTEEATRILVYVVNKINREAQHALLKVLEEPTAGTYIFFVLPSTATLLPTLVSRVHVINEQGDKQQYTEKLRAQNFLAMSVSDRLALVKKITDQKASDEVRLTKQEAIMFINELETVLAHDKNARKNFDIFSELRETRSYLHDSGSSVKMLLEHISLLV